MAIFLLIFQLKNKDYIEILKSIKTRRRDNNAYETREPDGKSGGVHL
jgi:hypothetical protein